MYNHKLILKSLCRTSDYPKNHVMSSYKKRLILVLLPAIFSCSKQPMHFDLIQFTNQYHVPSASGLVYHNNYYYAIGDDAPYLYVLDSTFDLVHTLPIHPDAGKGIGRISKKEKPDYEAMELVGPDEIAVFGSGSKTDKRNGMLRIFLGDPLRLEKHDLGDFYSILKKMSGLEKDFNIEAAAADGDRLYLFNRKKNLIFVFSYKSLLEFLQGLGPMPQTEIYRYQLPFIDGVEAGFSGATFYEGKLLVTASVEVTDNPVDDGIVLGSFIGILPTEDGVPNKKAIWILVETTGEPVKIESITVTTKIGITSLGITMTTDSDGGESHLIQGILRL
jgi:hypothetical protein